MNEVNADVTEEKSSQTAWTEQENRVFGRVYKISVE